MNNNIAGKVIVITGASSGLGEASARRLASEEATVVLGARRQDRIQALASEFANGGGKAIAVKTDAHIPTATTTTTGDRNSQLVQNRPKITHLIA